MTTSSPDSSDRLSPGPVSGPGAPPLDLGAALWRSLPGRLVLVASGLLAVLLAFGLAGDLPFIFDFARRIVWISWLVGVTWLVSQVVLRNRLVVLWRVRRKLLLSYVFFGVVPVVLVLAFALAAAVLFYVTVAKYVFLESYTDHVRVVRDIAETSAVEVGRTPTLAASGLERRYDNWSDRYPGLSLALVPVSEAAAGPALPPVLTAGAWRHGPAPTTVPGWVIAGRGVAGTFVVSGGGSAAPLLVIRAAVVTADGRRVAVVDLPVDERFVTALRDETGITTGAVSVTGCDAAPPAAEALVTDRGALFRETVAFEDCRSWRDGTTGRIAVALEAPVRELYDRLAAFNLSPDVSSASWASVLLQLLWLLGVLFLIVQGSAIVMGALLARSITSAVHELFEGTERVRQGDFGHRIRIESPDQLGALAGSFNRMSESIEHLLHVQREKQRLDDELRIAREIQKSLLPVRPPVMAGLDIADLCEPAREVGGDYYDFFELGPRQLGVMIADVSGKGTSAALYMAELKGIMLALSRADRLPRTVLLEVNRLLGAHLDNRSFITMTYAVIDLDQRRVTMARAGHTPMMLVSASATEVVLPGGMVLGLRLPGADALFARVLEERELPLAVGDVVVLYTDGVTDAMDQGGELFGDDALLRTVAGNVGLSAAGIRERVLREVGAFVGRAEAHDDMTMVIVKVTGDGGHV